MFAEGVGGNLVPAESTGFGCLSMTPEAVEPVKRSYELSKGEKRRGLEAIISHWAANLYSKIYFEWLAVRSDTIADLGAITVLLRAIPARAGVVREDGKNTSECTFLWLLFAQVEARCDLSVVAYAQLLAGYIERTASYHKPI